MIIITGTLAYDYIMEFPGEFGEHILPEHTGKINLSFIVNKFAKRRGGTAGNVSYTMGLLKTPHKVFSYAGNDFSEYKKSFSEMGIDTSGIKIDNDEHTATGFALSDKANNQIWGYYYGASKNIPSLNLAQVATSKDIVLIGPQGVDGSMSFVKQCINLRIPYLLDPGFILTQVSDEDLAIGIKHSSIIAANEYEIVLIKKRVKNFNDIVRNKIVITTLGEKGSRIQDEKGIYDILPVKAQKVVSTTGAGDAWRGGFLAGLNRGYDLKTCGQMGSVAGCFAVGFYGTQEHTYTLSEFKHIYRQFYGDLINL